MVGVYSPKMECTLRVQEGVSVYKDAFIFIVVLFVIACVVGIVTDVVVIIIIVVVVAFVAIVFVFLFLSLSVCLRLRIKESRQRENEREIEGHSPRFMYAVCIRFAFCLIHAIPNPQNMFVAMYNTGINSKLIYVYKLVK